MNWHPLPYWQHSAWQTTTEIYSFQRLYHASHFCSTTLGSPKLFECSVTRMWAMPMDCETFPKFRFRRTATLNDSSIPVQSQLSECGFPSGAFHIWRIMGCSRTAGATSSRDDLKDGSTCPWYLDISSTYFLPIFTYDISDSFSPILSRGAGRSSVLVVFFWCTGILWACYHQPSLNHDLKKFLQETQTWYLESTHRIFHGIPYSLVWLCNPSWHAVQFGGGLNSTNLSKVIFSRRSEPLGLPFSTWEVDSSGSPSIREFSKSLGKSSNCSSCLWDATLSGNEVPYLWSTTVLVVMIVRDAFPEPWTSDISTTLYTPCSLIPESSLHPRRCFCTKLRALNVWLVMD